MVNSSAAMESNGTAEEATRQTPRLYQEEICEKAVEQNVIAYLGTGTGKTFIAMMVINQKADAILAAGKIIVFFAPTVALVNQQAYALDRWLSLRVRMCVGETGVDAWQEADWQQLRQEVDVVVCTPMVMFNALSRSFMQMKHIGMLVVDECHQCRKNDPANRIMHSFYHPLLREERPHVFGMTASPAAAGGGKRSRTAVQLAFQELEQNLDAKIITVLNREEVEAVAPRAEVLGVEYPGDVLSAAAASFRDRLNAACGLVEVAADCIKQRHVLRDQQVLAAQLLDTMGAGVLDDVELERLGVRNTVEQIAAWLKGVRWVATDMGPWPAAVALAEVLGKPEEEAPDYSHWQAAWNTEHDPDLEPGPPDAPKSEGAMRLQDRVAQLSEELRVTCQHLQLLLHLFEGGGAVFPMPGDAAPAGGQLLTGHPIDGRLPLEAQAVQAALRGTFDALATVLVPAAAQRAELCAAFEQAVSGSSLQSATDGALRPCVEALLAAVPCAALAANVLRQYEDPVSQAWEKSMGCPLVANKPRAAIQYLLHDLEEYGITAAAPAGSLSASSDSNAADAAAAPATADQRWSCIIFVQRKLTAACLRRLMESIPEVAEKLPAAIITGAGGRVAAMSMQRQVKVLDRFKRGKVVALVATSVAEEGLDLRSCQLVLRYDLPANVLSFVQSRGRARKRRSRMVLLLRADDLEQKAMVRKIQTDEQQMQHVAQQRTQQLDAEEGEDGDGDDGDLEGWAQLLAAGGEDMEYRVPSTGAVATLAGAKQLLHMYCQKLPTDKYTLMRPRFTRPRPQDGLQPPLSVCGVVLPNTAPVHYVEGTPQRSFRVARASAALAAIRALHLAGALSDHLQPLVQELEEAGAGIDDEEDEEEHAGAAAGDRVPVSVTQEVPDVLTWDGGGRFAPLPGLTKPGQSCMLHAYGFSLEPLCSSSAGGSAAGAQRRASDVQRPSDEVEWASDVGRASTRGECREAGSTRDGQIERSSGSVGGATAGDAEPAPHAVTRGPGDADEAHLAAGEMDSWSEELYLAVEEWGLLLPRELPDLPAFRIFVPQQDGQQPRMLRARVVHRGHVTVGGDVLRCLQAAHSSAVQNISIKAKHKHLMGGQATASIDDLPKEPIPPEAWTSSSHGAWYILTPLLKRPEQQTHLASCSATSSSRRVSEDALETATADISAAPEGATCMQLQAQVDWPVVDRLLRGIVPLEAAFDFAAFADPGYRQLADDALLRMTVGCVVETRYNGCRYRVLGPAPRPTTLRSPFPPPSEGQAAGEEYSTYLDYYERRHLQAGLVPDQPLLLATHRVSLPGAAHILAPLARGKKRPAAVEAGRRGRRRVSTSRTSRDADAAASIGSCPKVETGGTRDVPLARVGCSRNTPETAHSATDKELLAGEQQQEGKNLQGPEHGVPDAGCDTGPKEGVPDAAPVEAVSEAGPEGVPDAACRDGAPDAASKAGMSEAGPEGVLDAGPKGGAPDAAPKEGVPEAAPKESAHAESNTAPGAVPAEGNELDVLDNKANSRSQPQRGSQVASEVLLPGQVCCLHPVGVWQWRALQLLPALSYRLHSLLLMHQARDTLLAIPGLPRQHGLEELLAAFTTTATLEDFNLERCELLGDAVLKLTTCYALFRHHPGEHEGLLTARKDLLVSNRHLAAAAERAGLQRYLRIWQYDHSAWLLRQPGLPSPPPPTSGHVKRKTLADLVEALLGLTFHTQGLSGTIALLRHLQLLPPHLLTHLELISAADTHLALQHLFTRPVQPVPAAQHPCDPTAAASRLAHGPPAHAGSSQPHDDHPVFSTMPPDGATGLPTRGRPMMASDTLDAIAAPAADPKSQRLKAERLARASRAVGWVFGNTDLVHEALTHCSWPYPKPPCYQRLEFLGDAVLDLLVTYQLFIIYPDLPPGQLHPRKAGIVNNHRLAMLAARAELQKGLVHYNAALQADITRYLDRLHEQQQQPPPQQQHQPQEMEATAGSERQPAEGAAETAQLQATDGDAGKGRDGDEVAVVEAPKVMADIVEALLGAVFLDCGGDLLAAAQVCTRLHLLAPGTATHRHDQEAHGPGGLAGPSLSP